MQIRFIGATDGHVTGSCTHFKYDRKNIQFLVDCGMVQGEGDEQVVNSKPFPFSPTEISFVLLTHAHQDHCGLIPKLYREGFRGRVICTTATAKLAKLSLHDSMKFVNKLFSEEDIEGIHFDMIDKRSSFGLSRMLPISDDLFVSFSRTAHILGAMSITIGWIDEDEQKRSIVMSGDIGNNTKENPYQPLLAGRQDIFGFPDVIVTESTYGGRVRDDVYFDFDRRMQQLRAIIQEIVFDRKEVLIIPAFALHRTQEILVDICYVLTHFFGREEDCLSPFYGAKSLDEELRDGRWDHTVQRSLKYAIQTLEESMQDDWNNAIREGVYEGKTFFSLATDSNFVIEDVKLLLNTRGIVYPVSVLLDGVLAKKMSVVYREELGRRQAKDPSETYYRNRKLPERFGMNGEDELDQFFADILPNNEQEDHSFALGFHEVSFRANARFPRKPVMQEKGLIIITGGGMCDSGPILKHLEDVFKAKRNATLLTTGYLPADSLGANLVAHCNNFSLGLDGPSAPLMINDHRYSVGSFLTVKSMNDYYSGHADQSGLLNFIFQIAGREKSLDNLKPATVILNHGQHAARAELKAAIEARASISSPDDRPIEKVELSRNSEYWFDLKSKEWVVPEKLSSTDTLLKELLAEQRKTNMLLAALLNSKPKAANTHNSKKR